MFEMGNQGAEEAVLMMLLHRCLAFSPFSELWPCTVGQQAMHVIVEWSLVTVWNGHQWQYGMVTGDSVEWTPVTTWHGHLCSHPVYLYTSLLPWSPWTHGNASSSHKSCHPPKGCQTSVQFLHRSWAGPRARLSSAGRPGDGCAGGDVHWLLEQCCMDTFPTVPSSSCWTGVCSVWCVHISKTVCPFQAAVIPVALDPTRIIRWLPRTLKIV